MTDLSRDIALRLKAARKAAGYTTAKQFAKQNSMPESTYNQYETGKRQFTADSILKLSTILGVEPNWLLAGKLPAFINNDSDKEVVLLQELNALYEGGVESLLNCLSISKHQRYAVIELHLLQTLLVELMKLISKNITLLQILNFEDLIDYIFDIYNNVVTTYADNQTRNKMMKLAISSLNTSSSLNAYSETQLINST